MSDALAKWQLMAMLWPQKYYPWIAKETGKYIICCTGPAFDVELDAGQAVMLQYPSYVVGPI